MTQPHPLVLVVDDEPGILRLLKVELEAQDFRVISARSGPEALDLIRKDRPDIVVLDIMMPEMSGLEVMHQVKAASNLPVILLTARDSTSDIVNGLESGADDYVVKPFSPEELGARVRAVMRRSESAADHSRHVITTGGIEIDLDRRMVMRDGQMLALTRTEWLLLQHLAANAGRVMLNGELLSKVWGPEYREDVQYLRVWVSRLRHKVEPDPANPTIVRTVPGIGYMLTTDAA